MDKNKPEMDKNKPAPAPAPAAPAPAATFTDPAGPEGFQAAATPVVVEAVGTATSSSMRDVSSAEVEAVMSQAVLDAYAAGIQDPDKIRALKLKARDDLKAARLKAGAGLVAEIAPAS